MKELSLNWGWLEVYLRIGRRRAALGRYWVASRERTREMQREIAGRLQRRLA